MKNHIIVGMFVILVLFGCTSNTEVTHNDTQPDVVPPNTTIDETPDNTTLVLGRLEMGSHEAPVVIVEFADYQCPFCRKFWQYSLPQLKADYIDTGKVQYIYRNFPLPQHPGAQKAAEAVECAMEQDLVSSNALSENESLAWKLHNKIFSEQALHGYGVVMITENDFKHWAQDVGANSEVFDRCLDEGLTIDVVARDVNDGLRASVNATPAFIIMTRDGRNVVPLTGAQSYKTINATIAEMLRQ